MKSRCISGKKPLLILLASHFSLLTCFCFAQNPDIKRTYHWYFGGQAGLDFSSGPPVAVTNGQLNSSEACSTISDTSGNLLLYTDGLTIWDRNHQIMQNGTGLMGCQSSTQGSLIVPLPQNDSLYYIFTTDCWENNYVNGLRYSIVNIKLNGGLGAVMQKNILLDTLISEKLTGTYHANGNNIWIITHELNTNNFLSFLITNAGITQPPIISSIGSIVSGTSGIGVMKVSPDGKYLAVANWGNSPPSSSVELFKYNDSLGILDSMIFSDANGFLYESYGISFSSLSSKLYVGFANINGLFQYDITAGTSTDILNSRTLLGVGIGGGLQLASDGKIYFASKTIDDSISVINYPDLQGTACNISFNIKSLNGKYGYGTFQNFIDGYLNNILPESIIEISQNNNDFRVYPNPSLGIANFKISNNTREKIISIYNTVGYLVKVIKTNKSFIDISELPSAIYFIKIEADNCFYNQKIILQH